MSPYVSLVQTSTPDFAVGTTYGVDISNNRIKLSGRNGFWQQERLSALPAAVYDGGGMAVANNKLYILRGNTSNVFYIYDTVTDAISTGQTPPLEH